MRWIEKFTTMNDLKETIDRMKMPPEWKESVSSEIERAMNEFESGQITSEQGKELLEYLVVRGYYCGKHAILEEMQPAMTKLKELQEML